jgi:2-dehydro-3-deoxyphosphogluconate aldolase/(4S)-4-hydroxy-2-oxoglutarate aldolase
MIQCKVKDDTNSIIHYSLFTIKWRVNKMVEKEKVITRISEAGIVAVVRAESSEQALKIADACIEGGVAAIELTFTVPAAHKVIEELAKTYTKGEIILGAGTVMDSETARVAILSGAQYVVSPYFNLETVKLCNRYRIPCMPGAMTIKEVVEAMEAGADIIKIFPGEAFGPKIIKAIKGPIPYAKMMPTGGVDVNNVGEWIKAGAVAVGAGGALTAGAKTGDYASITRIGKEFVQNIKEARGL